MQVFAQSGITDSTLCRLRLCSRATFRPLGIFAYRQDDEGVAVRASSRVLATIRSFAHTTAVRLEEEGEELAFQAGIL